MKYPSEETFEGKPSLMILNDDCIIKIFELLGLVDFANLSLTCTRLRQIANDVSRRKYKNILVDSIGYETETKITKQQFVSSFSQIGKHVMEVEIKDGNQFILEAVNAKCENLNRLTLDHCYRPLEFPAFKYLRELVCYCSGMSIHEWRSSFAVNQNLESLQWYHYQYEEGFMESLKMLPKLKKFGFRVPWYFNLSDDLKHLLCLNGLTELTLISSANCNELLIKLSKMSNLVVLKIMAVFNADSFRIIKSFRNLEGLFIYKSERMNDWEKEWFSDATVLPPKLKNLDVRKMKISFSAFLSIVKHLKFLEKFQTDTTAIFQDHDKCKISIHAVEVESCILFVNFSFQLSVSPIPMGLHKFMMN